MAGHSNLMVCAVRGLLAICLAQEFGPPGQYVAIVQRSDHATPHLQTTPLSPLADKASLDSLYEFHDLWHDWSLVITECLRWSLPKRVTLDLEGRHPPALSNRPVQSRNHACCMVFFSFVTPTLPTCRKSANPNPRHLDQTLRPQALVSPQLVTSYMEGMELQASWQKA